MRINPVLVGVRNQRRQNNNSHLFLFPPIGECYMRSPIGGGASVSIFIVLYNG